MKKMMLVSGSSNEPLAEKISDFLDVPLLDPRLSRFSNGEIFCRFVESVRGCDVFVIQSSCEPVNDNMMELLIMIDGLKRASASSITVVMPHFPYSRQDRKVEPRTPISSKLMADLLTVAGATRFMTMDLHAGQIQGFFNIPSDNIYAAPIFFEYMKKNISLKNLTIISPDSGGVERARYYAKKLNAEIAIIDKRREGPNLAKAMNLVGDVKGRDCIIVDDIIDTAGTLLEGCKAIRDQGANRVLACATHGVFSGPALNRIQETKDIDKILVTDTVPVLEMAKNISKIEVLSVAPILAKAIHRTFNDDSVSSLFV